MSNGGEPMDTLDRLLSFTKFLTSKKVPFTIQQSAADELMVSFATFGNRYEVYFRSAYVTYSVFTGNEDVLDDLETVRRDVEEFRRG